MAASGSSGRCSGNVWAKSASSRQPPSQIGRQNPDARVETEAAWTTCLLGLDSLEKALSSGRRLEAI
jgi:hypothetical protein